jgi:hypothetical protein
MSFIHGKSTFIMLNGYDITGYLNKIETPATSDTAETSVFGLNNKTYLPGLKDATFSAEGLYEGTAAKIDQILNSILSSQELGNDIFWIPEGNVIGNKGYAMHMFQTAYNTTATKDDATRINVAGQSSGGRERVSLIKAYASVPSSSASVAQNNSGSSANGGVAYIHASAVTGSLDAIIEESATGAFGGEEDTLVTFAQLTTLGYERVEIAAGTTIKQYVRVKYTIVTGPSVFAVILCRK